VPPRSRHAIAACHGGALTLVFHSHRSPVTVYVLEGAFTLDLEGRVPVVVQSGQAFVEPPHVKMTGTDRASEPLRLVIFHVSDPDTPFLDGH
jgi:quercetin dioxygenase-like cupin family protein